MNGYGQYDNFCEKLADQLGATDVGICIINVIYGFILTMIGGVG